MLFDKVSGGAERAFIDGQPVRDKINLKSFIEREWDKESLFPDLKNLYEANIFELNNREYLIFDGYASLYRGNIKDGWTELNLKQRCTKTKKTFIKNNEFYYISEDSLKIVKYNIDTNEETVINIEPFHYNTKVAECLAYIDENRVFVIVEINGSSSYYIVDIKNLFVTDITYPTFKGDDYPKLSFSDFFKIDNINYISASDRGKYIFKTTDFNNFEKITTNEYKGPYDASIEYNGEYYILEFYNKEIFFNKFNKIEGRFEDTGKSLRDDVGNRFDNGPSFLYIDKTSKEEKYYLCIRNTKKIVLLNSKIYKEV